jgi:hypothetical protein
MKKRGIKKLVMCIVAVVVILGGIYLLYRTHNAYETYGDYKIYKEELEIAKDKNRAAVLRETKLGGEKSEALLHEKAVSDCIRNQIIFNLGHQYKLIDFKNFKELKKELKKVNKERKETAENGGVIYGPEVYSLADYSDYLINNLSIQLPKIMEKTYFKVDEDSLKTYYDENKEALFSYAEKIEIMLISKDFDSIEEAQNFEANAIAELQEMPWEVVAAEYGDEGSQTGFEIKKNSIMYSRYQGVYELATTIEIGEVGSLVSGNEVQLFKVLGKNEAQETGFEEAKDSVKEGYLKEQFESYVKKQLDEVNKKEN